MLAYEVNAVGPILVIKVQYFYLKILGYIRHVMVLKYRNKKMLSLWPM